MKYFISFILTLLLAGCNLFQKQQPAGESVASFWKDEVFVPVEKELYVIVPTAMQYTEPDIHSNPEEAVNSFGKRRHGRLGSPEVQNDWGGTCREYLWRYF